jgi:hypothetical protein
MDLGTFVDMTLGDGRLSKRGQGRIECNVSETVAVR